MERLVLSAARPTRFLVPLGQQHDYSRRLLDALGDSRALPRMNSNTPLFLTSDFRLLTSDFRPLTSGLFLKEQRDESRSHSLPG
jgi:hypothetical protein